jgi:hypothetical protein
MNHLLRKGVSLAVSVCLAGSMAQAQDSNQDTEVPCFWANLPIDNRTPDELEDIYQSGLMLREKFSKLRSFYTVGSSECLFKDRTQEFCMLVIVTSDVVASYYNSIVSGDRINGFRYVFVSLAEITATKGSITIGN